MKISIYELLGLIKEGKAPKKIKIDGYILKLQENETYWKSKYIDKQGDSLFLDYHITLNDEVEIIEEEKEIEIEKIEGSNLINTRDILELEMLINKRFADYDYKINQLIDVINDMRDKE